MATVKYFQTNDTNDKNNISLRNVVFSIVSTYFMLISGMLVLSLFVVYGSLGTETAESLVNAVYYFSCFICGFLSSVNLRKRGWFNGLITSVAYFGVVVLSVIVVSEAEVSVMVAVRLAVTVIIGIAGGITGVNTGKKKKR